MNFKLSNEIYEELTSNKYLTLFEIEIGGKEIIKVVRYEDYEKLENIIKEVREEVRILESNCDISNYHAQKLYQTLDKEGVN